MAAWSIALHSHRGGQCTSCQQLFWNPQRIVRGITGVAGQGYDVLAWTGQELGVQPGLLAKQFVQAGFVRTAGSGRGVTAEIASRLCRQGQVSQSVEALGVLVRIDCSIPQSLVYEILRSFGVNKDLVLGRRVHALAVETGFESDTFLCNHFLRMYASHGMLQEAMDVFTIVGEPDAFMWSSIISAHVQQGQAKQAIELYHQMCRTSSVKPDRYVYVAALQACARGQDLKTGHQVHAHVLASGVETDAFLSNCLVFMYAKCGSFGDAKRLFEGLPFKDVVTWTALIGGYFQQGRGLDALRLYAAMQEDGMVAPDSVTFVCLLQACASVGAQALEIGKQLHAQISERGIQLDLVVANSLVDMYAKCGSLEGAQGVFDGLGHKNVITWNAMLAGYSQQGLGEEALHLYAAMQKEGMAPPDSVTFICLLKACASLGPPALLIGKELHAQMECGGLQGDVVMGSSLVNMYAKCGSLEEAQSVFDGLGEKDLVTWTALMAGYSHCGMGQKALELYSAMRNESSVAPDSMTFVCLLQACASLGNAGFETGKELHAQIRERGLQCDRVVGCSLVNMYAKCGSLEDAQAVFDGLDQKDVVTWNAMIAGHSQQGMGQEALQLYSAMRSESSAAPDSVTFLCLLQACANVAALRMGRHLHVQIEEQGLQADVSVGISLINMYAKSGSMLDAQQVFDGLLRKDIVAWNALIAGYTRHGDSDMVFSLVHRMGEAGVQPDSITFVSVLTACSHAGLVDTGRDLFEAMSRQYGIPPNGDHYACMVDLLGRAGQLDEAMAVVRDMPVLPNAAVWHTLLGACQKWGNVDVGCHAFEEAVKLDEKDAAAYVLMSNIYSSARMWEQAQRTQRRRLEIGAWKEPGRSWWTDLSGLVHSFVGCDIRISKVKAFIQIY